MEEDYKGSHVLLFDLNDSQASSSFSIGGTSLCSHQEDDNKVKLKTKHDQDEAYKWMPSKMRILRKMMMSSCQESPQKKFSCSTTINIHPAANSSRRPTYDDMMDDSARVCADCNTTKTPLWRSGPRGPKSLCNACGIRQRKARRAMAAAAASGTILGVSAPTPPLKKIKKLKHKKKKKRSKGGLHDNNNRHDDQLNKIKAISHKSSSSSSNCKKELSVDHGLEDLRSRVVLSNKYYNANKVFPQDEKEAAILLMALSSGILSN